MNTTKLWDKESPVPILGGTILNGETLYQKHQHIAKTSGVVLEYSGDICVAIDSLDILKEIYEIAPELDDEAALADILYKKEHPPGEVEM